MKGARMAVDAEGREPLAATMRRVYPPLTHAERHRICRMVAHVNYRAGAGERPRIARRWRRYGAPPKREP